MKRPFKVLLCSCFFFVGFSLVALVSSRLWLKHRYHFPPQERVREQFENKRADYTQFVTLLHRDQSAHIVDGDGRVAVDGAHSRAIPEYRDLIRKIGAKDVTIRQDGSIEFALYGFGYAICSDSYMGVRYHPKDRATDVPSGLEPTAVASLDNAKLPHENGAIATGLYVVPIEPEWFIYRFEYRE